MKFSLSTNWCNRRIEAGEEIVEQALDLGFEELELGFHTTDLQAKEIAALSSRIPIGSIHAFCPVPISAPQGYPELYHLVDFDEETRKLAAIYVKRNIQFAASVGADTVVLHAGRVACRGFFSRWDLRRRVKRGRKLVDIARRELEGLLPELERNHVVLGLENLPYLEGFPAEWELKDLVGEWVKPWLDTGHDFVRRVNQWPSSCGCEIPFIQPVGLHISDSCGGDDHLPPGSGGVDFLSLREVAQKARHVVFEPSPRVSASDLSRGLAHLRKIWNL